MSLKLDMRKEAQTERILQQQNEVLRTTAELYYCCDNHESNCSKFHEYNLNQLINIARKLTNIHPIDISQHSTLLLGILNGRL